MASTCVPPLVPPQISYVTSPMRRTLVVIVVPARAAMSGLTLVLPAPHERAPVPLRTISDQP